MNFRESEALRNALAVKGEPVPPPAPPPAPPDPAVVPATPVDERKALLQEFYPQSWREGSMK